MLGSDELSRQVHALFLTVSKHGDDAIGTAIVRMEVIIGHVGWREVVRVASEMLTELEWSIDQISDWSDLAKLTPNDRIHAVIGKPGQLTKRNIKPS